MSARARRSPSTGWPPWRSSASPAPTSSCCATARKPPPLRSPRSWRRCRPPPPSTTSASSRATSSRTGRGSCSSPEHRASRSTTSSGSCGRCAARWMRPHALQLSVGVSRGRVFAGEVGAPFRRTYTILGGTAALAARLMAKAEPGQIFVPEQLLELSATTFEVEQVAPLAGEGDRRAGPRGLARRDPERAGRRARQREPSRR